MEDFEKIELNENESAPETTETSESAVSAENTESAESTDPVVEEANGYSEDTEIDTPDTIPEIPMDDNGKKVKVQKPIIIAACVLIAALIAAGVYFLFFNNSVVGTWVIDESASTSDEASKTKAEENIRYYTFNDDGTASIKLGTIEIFGTWNYTDTSSSSADEKTDKIDIEILPIIKGTFEFELKGNAFSGRVFTLTSNQSSIDFKSASKVEPDLKVSAKFKADKNVTGKWKNKDYNLIYDFKDDGTCHLSNNDRITTTGTYTVDSNKKQITVVYIGEEKSKMYIPYAKGEKKNQLILSGYKFSKVTE